jgi:hypothetical protein
MALRDVTPDDDALIPDATRQSHCNCTDDLNLGSAREAGSAISEPDIVVDRCVALY